MSGNIWREVTTRRP